jgi:hypothetical protein
VKNQPRLLKVEELKPHHIFRWLTGISAALTASAAWQIESVLDSAGILEYPVWQTRLVMLQTSLYAIAVILLGLAISPLAKWLTERLQQLAGWIQPRRGWVFPVIGLILGFMLYVTMGAFYLYQAGKLVQGWLIWLSGLTVGLLLKAAWPRRGLFFWLAGGLLGVGFVLQLGVLFSKVTNYPFAQQWSEGMLLVNAAQVAGTKLWGQAVTWPAMNRTHAILQSLSFWLPGDNPLWVHRMWNSFLWLGLPLGLVASLGWRLRIGSPVVGFFFTLFGYLFLSQGPVYFNLTVIPLVILLGFRSNRFGRSLLLVFVASIWAGLSRINWFPMAGVVAAFLYILETPYCGKFWRYFWCPAIWVGAGTITAFVANQIYLVISGSGANHVTRSLSSTLLWYRLWPSATFPMGLMPALALVSCGLLGLVYWRILRRGGIHLWRRTAILLIFLVFMTGGLVVSIKIGGGDNLHNLDAFLVLLLLAAGYIFFDRVSMDTEPVSIHKMSVWLTAVVILLPIIYQVPFLPYHPPIYEQDIAWVNAQLEQQIEKTLATGKRVLFISNQQMIGINRFPGILPEPKYEVVNLMEMALSGDEEYFKEFYNLLSQQEWGLIVIDSLSLETAGREKSFGEEQSAWVKWVVEPIRKYYIPVGGNLQAMLILVEPR